MHNPFKQSLKNGDVALGLWLGLANPYSTELLANAGYDWLLIDGEHAPNDVHSTLAQLQAIAPYRSQPVVRIIEGNVALVKQTLDLGAQTLLIPMIETAAQAVLMVAATRYPLNHNGGIRGVGSALARASRWNQIPDYLQHANEQICVLLQVESVAGMAELSAIAATDGVDGVFFGPSDLAASMGYLGQPNHADVVSAIVDGIKTTLRHGKAAGVLATDLTAAQTYLAAGAQFVAIGVDTSLLMQAAKSTLDKVRPTPTASSSSGY